MEHTISHINHGTQSHTTTMEHTITQPPALIRSNFWPSDQVYFLALTSSLFSGPQIRSIFWPQLCYVTKPSRYLSLYLLAISPDSMPKKNLNLQFSSVSRRTASFIFATWQTFKPLIHQHFIIENVSKIKACVKSKKI